jgi:hypothetical protein
MVGRLLAYSEATLEDFWKDVRRVLEDLLS